jgi:4-hydroxymandelate oxidase
LPPDVVSPGDYARHAQAALEPATWAYFDGPAGDGVTAAANLRAWRALSLLPRVLRPLVAAEAPRALLGRPLPRPLLVAPVALQQLAHPDGEVASALAAAAQGAGFVLSMQSSVPLETVARAVRNDAGRGPLWFQLTLQANRAATLDRVAQAESAGFEAVVVTVDAPVQGPRDAQRRAGFRMPAGAPAMQPAGGLAALLQAAPTWDDIAWLCSATRLPVVLKGVLHPDDAAEATRCGVQALIVSNHGGRMLDGAPATATMLPRIAAALDGRLPLLVDGGIRRGTDVVKALALGACAVLVGRPVAWALATAGAAGVAHLIRLLNDETSIALALCGCADPREAGAHLLGPRFPHPVSEE